MNWFASDKRQSFAVRIFIYLMTVLCVSILVQTATSLYQNQNRLRAELHDGGAALLRILVQSSRPAMYAEDHKGMARAAEAMMQHPDVRTVAHLGANLHLLQKALRPNEASDTSPCLEEKLFSGNWAELESLAPEAFFFLETTETFNFISPVFTTSAVVDQEDLLFLNPQEGGGAAAQTERIGYVCLCLDKKRLDIYRRAAMESAVVIAGVMLLLGGLVTFFISRAASAPLRQVIQNMRSKAGVDTEGGEMELLSGAFDNLVRSMEGAFNTIADLKANLEIRVQERTEELAQANEELNLRQDELITTNQNLEDALFRLKQTQAQLVQSEKMVAVGQLVAGVAHEVNNTINFISGSLPPISKSMEKIRTGLATLDAADCAGILSQFSDVESFLDNIREGVRRTTRIVQDLRIFSRSTPEEDIRPADIHRGLDSTLNLMHTSLKYKAKVIREFGENIPPVWCNPSQINQVFMNILLNAVQAIPDQDMGVITVTTSMEENGMVQIAISDTGTGIPAAHLDRVFDPFFTTKSAGKGTGLGLSIVYSIIEKHGGRIFVESEEGKGATFRVLLPVGGEKRHSV